MPRLPDPDPRSVADDVAQFLATLPPDPMFATLAHAATIIGPFMGLARALYTTLDLPARTRELSILTLAEETGSAFVWTQHVPISEAAGVTSETRQLIRDRDYRNPALSGPDRTILQFTAAAASSPHVSDELFAAVRAVLSEREVVEIMQVIGYYWTLSRISTVFEVHATQLYAHEYGTHWPSIPILSGAAQSGNSPNLPLSTRSRGTAKGPHSGTSGRHE
jgi:alkylhydroperoxidase family enzyme